MNLKCDRILWNDSPFPELYEKKINTPLCSMETIISGKQLDLIVVHHLHEVAYEFINSLSKKYNIRKIIGIPYSSLDSVVDKLKERFSVIVPKDISEISQLVKEAVSQSNKNVIIEEIGGYSSEISDYLDRCSHVLGVVEDTHQGHWRWEEAKLKRLPILSVAYSRPKRIEDTYVAKSIIDGTEKYLKEFELKSLKNLNAHVIGYGNLGEHLTYF